MSPCLPAHQDLGERGCLLLDARLLDPTQKKKKMCFKKNSETGFHVPQAGLKLPT